MEDSIVFEGNERVMATSTLQNGSLRYVTRGFGSQLEKSAELILRD